MSDFAGYARTNLFKVKDLESFRVELAGLDFPVSQLHHESLAGFLWSGDGDPFSGDFDMARLSKFLKKHIEEPVFIVVAGALRGSSPVLDCTVVDTSGKTSKSDLAKIVNGREVDFSDAPVIWAS